MTRRQFLNALHVWLKDEFGEAAMDQPMTLADFGTVVMAVGKFGHTQREEFSTHLRAPRVVNKR